MGRWVGGQVGRSFLWAGRLGKDQIPMESYKGTVGLPSGRSSLGRLGRIREKDPKMVWDCPNNLGRGRGASGRLLALVSSSTQLVRVSPNPRTSVRPNRAYRRTSKHPCPRLISPYLNSHHLKHHLLHPLLVSPLLLSPPFSLLH